jgi:hypothetical protein
MVGDEHDVSRDLSRAVDLEADDVRDLDQVAVTCEQARPGAQRNSRNRAVEKPARRDPSGTAAAVDAGGSVEITHGVKGQQPKCEQHSPQI